MLANPHPEIWKARLAWLLSALLSPFVLVPLFAALLISELSEDRWQFFRLYLFCVGCAAGVPALYIGYYVFHGRITDMHVRELEQRRGPFLAGLCGLGAMALGLVIIGAPQALTFYSWAVFVNGIAFAQISKTWKISVHTGTLGAVLAGAVCILEWSCLWLILQFPLIWARAYRKRHHPRQGLAGAILGFLPVWLVLSWAFG